MRSFLLNVLPTISYCFSTSRVFFRTPLNHAYLSFQNTMRHTHKHTQTHTHTHTQTQTHTQMILFLLMFQKTFHPALPYILLGTFPAISGLLFLMTPETKGKPLPQSLDDVERMGAQSQSALWCVNINYK